MNNFEKQNSYEQNGVKHILYQAFKKDLPPNFGNRSKRGFKMPIEKWMKEGLISDIENTLTAKSTFLDSKNSEKVFRNWEKEKAERKL